MASNWHKVAEAGDLPEGQVTTVVAGVTAVCLVHTAEHGFTAFNNRCPHLNNEELGKISKEQRAGHFQVWQTSLHNPNFAAFAKLCGGQGFRVSKPDEMAAAIEAGLNADGPAIVEVLTDPTQT